jgi:hypothetical protein
MGPGLRRRSDESTNNYQVKNLFEYSAFMGLTEAENKMARAGISLAGWPESGTAAKNPYFTAWPDPGRRVHVPQS